jgi:hypothetical protein
MLWLSIVWAVFAIIFLILGIYHWLKMREKIPYLAMPERATIPNMTVVIKMAGEDIDAPLQRFSSDVNSFVDKYNKISKSEHRSQAIGYWVASATAIFSFVLTIIN